jgi:phenylalanyl-tRNA synthetase beta chain
MQAIASASGDDGLLQGASLFDIYRPQVARDGTVAASGGLAQGEKSMAVRLSFQSDAATLTDEQIEPAVRAIVDRLGAELGARLRG